eukprot:2429730-Rhodomonas_salina.1
MPRTHMHPSILCLGRINRRSIPPIVLGVPYDISRTSIAPILCLGRINRRSIRPVSSTFIARYKISCTRIASYEILCTLLQRDR